MQHQEQGTSLRICWASSWHNRQYTCGVPCNRHWTHCAAHAPSCSQSDSNRISDDPSIVKSGGGRATTVSSGIGPLPCLQAQLTDADDEGHGQQAPTHGCLIRRLILLSLLLLQLPLYLCIIKPHADGQRRRVQCTSHRGNALSKMLSTTARACSGPMTEDVGVWCS